MVNLYSIFRETSFIYLFTTQRCWANTLTHLQLRKKNTGETKINLTSVEALQILKRKRGNTMKIKIIQKLFKNKKSKRNNISSFLIIKNIFCLLRIIVYKVILEAKERANRKNLLPLPIKILKC